MNKSNNQKAIKQMIKKLKIGFLVGIVLILYGIIRYFYLSPNVGINLYSLLPVVIDGSIALIGGCLLSVGCLISIKNRKKVIHMEQKYLDLERKQKQNEPKWLKHY